MNTAWVAVVAAGMLGAGPPATVRVGSKTFTESVILGEIAGQLMRDDGIKVVHRRELGGTQVLFHALEADELDVVGREHLVVEQQTAEPTIPFGEATCYLQHQRIVDLPPSGASH